MGPNTLRWTLLLAVLVALSGRASTVVTEEDEYYLAGLGLHQDTGRNIYLGGIYLDSDKTRPPSLTQITRPWTMEYRIIARRTSIRSLLGGMLLQSEVATGSVPDKVTADFTNAILLTVNTPLYAGDSLTIKLDQNGTTSALLNGYELARTPDAGVAHYFLQGWIGETGPATTFRADLLAPEVNAALLATLTGNTYSAEREAQVAAWFEPSDPANDAASANEIDSTPDAAATIATADASIPPVPAAASVAGVTKAAAEVANLAEEMTDAPTTADTTVATTSTDHVGTQIEQSLSAVEPAKHKPDAGTTETATAAPLANAAKATQTTGEPIQVASLTPVSSGLQLLSNAEPSLGVQEYARRLSQFHGSVVAMVYKQIRYPTRAIRRDLQGRVELDVTFQRSGELLAIAVAQSSGHDILDAAAVKAAEGAFSAGLPGSIDPVAVAEFGNDDTLVVPIPVSFKLTE